MGENITKERLAFFNIIVKVCILIILISGTCLFSPETAQADINVLVYGNKLVMDTQPVIIEGRTLVPLRVIFESLGSIVKWDSETKTITAYKDDIKIILQIDNKTAHVNDIAIELDAPPTIIFDRTMVPVRFIAENLGETVLWDYQTQTVIIGNEPSIRTASNLNVDPPLNLQAIPTTDAQIRLSWFKSPGATNYIIYQAINSDSYKQVGNTIENVYEVSGLQSQKTYSFKVKARNDTNVSEYSNEASAATLDPQNRKTSLTSPASLNEDFIILRNDRKLEVSLVGLVTGKTAADMVKKANMFNATPDSNEMYILARFRVVVLSPLNMSSGIGWNSFSLFNSQGYQYDTRNMYPVAGIATNNEIDENTTEILVSCLVRDTDIPRLVLDKGYNSEIWFRLSR